MSSVADATGKFADRIVELLDIFDLSFFVSGAVGLGALVAAARLHGAPLPVGLAGLLDPTTPELGVEMLFVGIVASYVVGLGCFAVGRVVRARLHPESSAALMRAAIRHHRLGDVLDLGTYIDVRTDGPTQADDRLERLYSRLWVHVRTIEGLAASFALVKRYWILAATYDGMGVAALVWLWPLLGGALLLPATALGGAGTLLLAAVLVAAAAFCWRQAAEYRKYQVDELVATTVHWHALQQPVIAVVAPMPAPTSDV